MANPKTTPAEDFEEAQRANSKTADDVQANVEQEAKDAKAAAEKETALRLEAEKREADLKQQLADMQAQLEAQSRVQPTQRERRYARSRGAVTKSFDKNGKAEVVNPRAEA